MRGTLKNLQLGEKQALYCHFIEKPSNKIRVSFISRHRSDHEERHYFIYHVGSNLLHPNDHIHPQVALRGYIETFGLDR